MQHSRLHSGIPYMEGEGGGESENDGKLGSGMSRNDQVQFLVNSDDRTSLLCEAFQIFVDMVWCPFITALHGGGRGGGVMLSH
jgi:hypothetical protein